MMALGARAMRRADGEAGDGERREAAMRRRRAWTIGALVAVGGVCGFYVGFNEARTFFDGGSFWTPTVSLVLSGLFLLAIIGGTIFLQSTMDEVERDRGATRRPPPRAPPSSSCTPCGSCSGRAASCPSPSTGFSSCSSG